MERLMAQRVKVGKVELAKGDGAGCGRPKPRVVKGGLCALAKPTSVEAILVRLLQGERLPDGSLLLGPRCWVWVNLKPLAAALLHRLNLSISNFIIEILKYHFKFSRMIIFAK
jgi:hypothetical protein